MFLEMVTERTYMVPDKLDLSHGHLKCENNISTNCIPNQNSKEALTISLTICSI